MASNQDYTEDMAQGDFSNESYGDFQASGDQVQDNGDQQNGNIDAMEEASNGDGHHESSSHSGDHMGKDEDR